MTRMTGTDYTTGGGRPGPFHVSGVTGHAKIWSDGPSDPRGVRMAKVILVTGASAGIGRACADRLHESGWTVVGASRRGSSSKGWTPLAMDVDSDDSVR